MEKYVKEATTFSWGEGGLFEETCKKDSQPYSQKALDPELEGEATEG